MFLNVIKLHSAKKGKKLKFEKGQDRYFNIKRRAPGELGSGGSEGRGMARWEHFFLRRSDST